MSNKGKRQIEHHMDKIIEKYREDGIYAKHYYGIMNTETGKVEMPKLQYEVLHNGEYYAIKIDSTSRDWVEMSIYLVGDLLRIIQSGGNAIYVVLWEKENIVETFRVNELTEQIRRGDKMLHRGDGVVVEGYDILRIYHRGDKV